MAWFGGARPQDARRTWSSRTIAAAAQHIALVAALIAGLLAATPAPASAESLCSTTWVGPALGNWQTAADWSTGTVPSSSEVVCIGSGKTVQVIETADHAGVLQDHGTVEVSSGELSISSTLETSSAYNIALSGGRITNAGTLDVSHSLSWTGGFIVGKGSTVIQSGATGTINPPSYVQLSEGKLINDGTVTWSTGTLEMASKAEIENAGTFYANSENPEGSWFNTTILNNGEGNWIRNTGTFKKSSGTGISVAAVAFVNDGTVTAETGQLNFADGSYPGETSTGSWGSHEGASLAFSTGTFVWGSGISVSGLVYFSGGIVQAHDIQDTSGELLLWSSNSILELTSATTSSHAYNLTIKNETSLEGVGTLDISHAFTWTGGFMRGTGKAVVQSGATGTIDPESWVGMNEHVLANYGTTTWSSGTVEVEGSDGIENAGTFIANSESGIGIHKDGEDTWFHNSGIVEKTSGTGTTVISVEFENAGTVVAHTGKIEIPHQIFTRSYSTLYGGEGSLAPGQQRSLCGDPVSCATGNFSETQPDIAIAGRGVGLDLGRTYNSQAAAEGAHGAFGYGWTSSFSDHLVVEKASKLATLYEAEGGTVPFAEGAGGAFTAPVWSQDTLSGTAEAGYTLTLANQTKFKFAGSSGRLESVTDRDGNATTLTYTGEGRLEKITDPSGRKITLAYNAEGLVESAKDPMGHVVKYTYEGGNLASVTLPGETTARWQFKYDGSHQLTEMTDGRKGKTINEYNGSHQLIQQKDPAEHTLTFEYAPFQTKITNTTTGGVTLEQFTSGEEPSSVTRGYGTSSATTESFTYNEGGYVTSATDGDGHTTTYGYDGANDRTSMVDPDKDETKWTYDSTHDVETTTTPRGETTTIKREGHGNPETVSRPAPGSTTQTTTYKYGTHGELESLEDPLKRVWKYGYDSKGDPTSETDPEGDKRTWEYNEDSQETASVSPRGNATGAKASEFTTKFELDEQGRPKKITDPLGHTTKYTYDGDGNVETVTDGNSHTTTYTYSADNEPIKVKESTGIVTETEYNGANQIVSQTGGNKNVTKYVRSAVGEVTEVVDPLSRKTTKEYDAAGNLKTITDPLKRTTTYTYDPANRLTEVSYSDGKTHSVKYEYNADGERTTMTDGTGKSSYEYDQLDRLTESKDGHGDTSKYEYDLANERTKITYPNGKAVTRAYDKAGRLEKVTDWLEHATKFSYDADSDLATSVFPTTSVDEDKYAYNDADQMSEVKMSKGTETLASLVYTRDSDGQLKGATSKGLPGEEKPAYEYDADNRLTKGAGTAFEYDSANNPTKIATSTLKYDKADELETATGSTYTYDEAGERTKAKPSSGPATTYAYDQAGNLTSVERPKEGAITKIEDTYAYDGNSLRASQTISGTTSYLTWDPTEEIPVILNDGTNSYIYGPAGLPIEQINNSTGAVTYLHHDQAGSTRLLTGSTGTVTGKCTYNAYGVATCEGTSTTPLGYDGQYTSSDTGLIYLRNRTYDPSTAQFLTRDPLAALSGEPYSYAGDNPVNASDPTGLLFGIKLPSWEEAGEAVAGWGDTISFGVTKKIREGIGDENVDTCSGAYQSGGDAGLVTGALIPGEDDVVGAEVVEEGASNLGDQLTLEEAEAGAGERIMEGKINDPTYPEDEWAKMSHVHEYPDGSKTEIHYWEHLETGTREGFKFK
jgi:RHS repeat-associated protein